MKYGVILFSFPIIVISHYMRVSVTNLSSFLPFAFLQFYLIRIRQRGKLRDKTFPRSSIDISVIRDDTLSLASLKCVIFYITYMYILAFFDDRADVICGFRARLSLFLSAH